MAGNWEAGIIIQWLWSVVNEAIMVVKGTWWLVLCKGLLAISLLDRMAYFSPGKHTYIQGLLSHFIFSFGGGTCVAIITANPWPSLHNPILIPSHIVIFTFFFYSGKTAINTLRVLWPWISPVIMAADSIVRSCGIMRALDSFRNQAVIGPLASESLHGQLIVGTIAATGGGLVYRWFNDINRFQYPGYDFSVIIFAVCVNILLSGSPKWVASSLLNGVVDGPQMYSRDFIENICAVIIFAGLMLRPVIESRFLKSSTVYSQKVKAGTITHSSEPESDLATLARRRAKKELK